MTATLTVEQQRAEALDLAAQTLASAITAGVSLDISVSDLIEAADWILDGTRALEPVSTYRLGGLPDALMEVNAHAARLRDQGGDVTMVR